MGENVVRFITMLSAYIIVLPLIFGILKVKSGNREQRILSLLIFVSVFFEAAALIVGAVFHLNNLFLLPIFTVLEFGILAWIFKPNLKEVIPEKSTLALIGCFTLFTIINSLLLERIDTFNALGRAVEGILMLSLILTYFYIILKTLKVQRLEQSPLFWIAVGTLLYFSTSLFVFIFSNYFISSKEMSLTIWAIHAFLSIVLNLFYTIALWVKTEA